MAWEEKDRPHKCRAFIGEEPAFDLSLMLVRTRYSMPHGARRNLWGIEVGREDVDRAPLAAFLPEGHTLRVRVFFCPWCGDQLPREGGAL